MTEKMAEGLAGLLSGRTATMPASRSLGVLAPRADGSLASIEDHAGWAYRDAASYEAAQRDGDTEGLLDASEWAEWDGAESWALGLSRVLGSEAYWHSGGGIWLVFHTRPDGRFAVIGSESGAIYPSREAFEADEDGSSSESAYFI